MFESLTFFSMLFMLVFAHALADFPLQGSFLSQAKNHRQKPQQPKVWPWALFYHAMIHSGFVYVITGSMLLALVELALHAIIDWFHSEQKINFQVDQILHLLCKLLYVVIIFGGIAINVG